MKSTFFTCTFIALLLCSAGLQAQAVRNAAERTQDHNQIQTDKAQLERDQAELAQFRGNAQGFKDAVNNGNYDLAYGHHVKLVGIMEREARQADAKARQDVVEVHQSEAELRSSNREVRRDRAQGRPVAAAGDRVDRRDDRRDVRDDKQDLGEQRVRAARMNAIVEDFKAAQVRQDGLPALKEKFRLLDEFEQAMVRDMAETGEELMEDKQELREDRRETREDRNNR